VVERDLWTGSSSGSVGCVLLCKVKFWNFEMEKLFELESWYLFLLPLNLILNVILLIIYWKMSVVEPLLRSRKSRWLTRMM
jgi:hypothetical protein